MTKLINPKSLHVSTHLFGYYSKSTQNFISYIKKKLQHPFMPSKIILRKLKQFAKPQNQHHNNPTQIKH